MLFGEICHRAERDSSESARQCEGISSAEQLRVYVDLPVKSVSKTTLQLDSPGTTSRVFYSTSLSRPTMVRRLFLSLIAAASLLVVACHAAHTHRPTPGMIWDPTDLAADISSANEAVASEQRTRQVIDHIQQQFQLPEGTLAPTYPYYRAQYHRVHSRLQQLNPRFFPITQRADHMLYVVPSFMQRGQQRLPMLAFFRVHHNGDVVPLGVAGVTATEAGRTFWDNLIRGASTAWNQLPITHGSQLRLTHNF